MRSAFDGDTDAVVVTMPQTGIAYDTASAAASVTPIIGNTCLGVDHTTASAESTLELTAGSLYGAYASNAASAFQIGFSPNFSGLFAVENAHSGADFVLHGVVANAGTLILSGTLHHDLEIRFCPNVSPTHPSITTVHIVTTYLRVTGQGGTPLLTKRGVGFITERSDFDLITGPFPTPGVGFGDFSDLTTWDGSDNAVVYLPIIEEFAVAANDTIDAAAGVSSKSYTVDDYSQVADADEDGVLNPIADRDAFPMGAAYGDDAYSPFIDFDMDGDNDLSDYAVLDGLSELAMPCRIDFSENGFADTNDQVIFIDKFFAEMPSADIGSQGGVHAPDGQFNNNDFIVFWDYYFTSPC